MLTEVEYLSLQITHLGKDRLDDYGDAPSPETYCGSFRAGEAVVHFWSFKTVVRSFDPGRRPCKECRDMDGRY